ncbi:hypothetical protein SCOCK_140125 [Actinacidiphila cocklensis]|uniref:Transposase IS701-like DDE domain-containing protein n=1 Tax=Actinacidiphila cocklensis TaxID=887465 RepID=A0A9W4DKP3_9ACTN|nr:hypothetical protein SCOCK_140125 [Actinacidiphila cocklensis]
MMGPLSDLPRKNCWTIAEWAGEATPDGLQHLLGWAKWDAGAVRDDVREYVLDHLHDQDAVLVVDETGDVKKGTHTVGVQRQYTGTAGRIENSQVAVYLVYTGRHGHAVVDRELYTPRSWRTDDSQRCQAAGLDENTAFATKPELAARMIGRFFDAGHRVGWVAGQGFGVVSCCPVRNVLRAQLRGSATGIASTIAEFWARVGHNSSDSWSRCLFGGLQGERHRVRGSGSAFPSAARSRVAGDGTRLLLTVILLSRPWAFVTV